MIVMISSLYGITEIIADTAECLVVMVRDYSKTSPEHQNQCIDFLCRTCEKTNCYIVKTTLTKEELDGLGYHTDWSL